MQMPFQLKYSPRFLHHKREILSLFATPEIKLPREVEACLKGDLLISPKSGNLWSECFKAVQSLIIRSIGISIVMALCASAATLAAMKLLKSDPIKTHLYGLALAYFVASALMQIGSFFNNLLRNSADHTVHALLVSLISQKLLRLSSRAKARQTSGNLKVLITSDTLHIAEFVDNFIRSFIPAIVGLVVVLPLIVKLSGRAGLAGALIMVFVLPLSAGLNLISVYFQEKGQSALDSLATLLGEWVKNIRLIRYLSWGDSFQQDIALRLRRYLTQATAQHLMACLIFGISTSWWMVCVCAIFGIARWFHSPLDVVGFFGTLWLITFINGYFIHLPNLFRLYGQASPSITRIALLLAEEEQKALFNWETVEKTPITSTPIRVIFKNVSFSYSDSFAGSYSGSYIDANSDQKFTVQNLSATFALNRKVAIVGEVACGKSTFLKLFCGEYPPTQGQIIVEFDDGKSYNLWDEACHQAYRNHIAWVPQEPFISSDPLSSNISLTTANQLEASIIEAAYWAELKADISVLPRGIHEEIGEGGVNLSGGAKTKIKYRSSLLRRSSILCSR